MIAEFSEKTKIVMQLLYSRLSEKDRRHYAAMESLKLGRGGINYICEVLGVDKKTIRKGRKELIDVTAIVSEFQQRKAGGGRKKNDKIS